MKVNCDKMIQSNNSSTPNTRKWLVNVQRRPADKEILTRRAMLTTNLDVTPMLAHATKQHGIAQLLVFHDA